MAEPYFALIRRAGDARIYDSSPATGGPWAEHLQHGGPPNALAVHAAQETVREQTGREDLEGLRLAAEFVGPVPVAELTVRASVVRAARSAALVDVEISSAERICLHSRVWFVARTDTSVVASARRPREPEVDLPVMPAPFPYGETVEWRAERGAGMRQPGPAAVWARPRRLLLEGTETSGLARAALLGDSASGVSAELDWEEWSFQNVDLDIHLARPVVGEWLLLDASTQLGPAGSGLARSTLVDADGPVGATLQTLILAPLPPR